MDCFDADVLIYASTRDHPLGRPIRELLEATRAAPDRPRGIGSVLLLPELLSKPLRSDDDEELMRLTALLSRLDLLPFDVTTARLAAALGARHRLRAADAVHLATAVEAGADRFITNNRRDFPPSIDEIQITYPDDLP